MSQLGTLSSWRPLFPLFEQYGPKLQRVDGKEIDFRWEREWRVVGDFTISFEEIAFGLCPEDKISVFQAIIKNAFPFIDPDWSPDQLQKNLLAGGWKTLAEAL